LSGPYPEEEFFSDLLQVTQGATDEALARHMIHESKECSTGCRAGRALPALARRHSEPRAHQIVLPRRRALDAQCAVSHRREPRVAIAYEAEVIDLDIDHGMFLSANGAARG
jgi:tricarballylate dehydrogenase